MFNSTKYSVVSSAVLVSTILLVSGPATAGGLFGKGGLIRGSIGEALDKHVEKPILTPVATGAGKLLGSGGGALASGPTLSEDDILDDVADEDISPAPSGIEETVLFDDGNTALGMPGTDSGTMTPADGPGGVIIIDFGDGDLGTAPGVDELDPNTTTIVYE